MDIEDVKEVFIKDIINKYSKKKEASEQLGGNQVDPMG